MLDGLRKRLIEKLSMYLDEMVVFLFDGFGALVTAPTVCRALTSIRWSKNTMRQVAGERNASMLTRWYPPFSSASRQYGQRPV
jgi:hypothetical protein